MAWIRLDDQIPHHPKVLKAGPAATWLWVCCIAYSQKFLTNGHIPDQAFKTLCPGIHDVNRTLSKLIQAGLIERASGGVQVHDYLDFNESKAQAVARKKDQHETKSRAGRLGAFSRWQKNGRMPSIKESK